MFHIKAAISTKIITITLETMTGGKIIAMDGVSQVIITIMDGDFITRTII